MKLFVFFGLPGAGKTFCAKVAEKYFSYQLYDGDTDLTQEMLKAIHAQATISDDMRDVFFENLTESAKDLLKRYEKIIIHQTFIKEKYREQFLKTIPQTQFVLIDSDFTIRERRLKERKDFPIDEDYARKMADIFDTPKIKHLTLHNNFEGEEKIREQLNSILV